MYNNHDTSPTPNPRLRSILGGTQKSEALFRTIEAAYVGASQGTEGEAGAIAWSREKLITALVEGAKSNGVWMEDSSHIQGEPVGEGGEHKVYQDKSDPVYVIKYNRMTYSADSKAGFDSLLDGFICQGELFPELAYEIIGFAYDEDLNVSIVLKQHLVPADRYGKVEEIESWFVRNKFQKNQLSYWSNGRYLIHDYKPQNVLVGYDGGLFMIDPIIVSIL